MKYFGIYTNSGDVRTAIENEELAKPYVALVSGALDYNTLSPVNPYIGEWEQDGDNYVFVILNDDPAVWPEEFTGPVKIGTTYGYYEGNFVEFDINMYYYEGDSDSGFHIRLEGEGVSEAPEYQFYDEYDENWDSGVAVCEENSQSNITVDWNCTGKIFTFYSPDETCPATINTINPIGE